VIVKCNTSDDDDDDDDDDGRADIADLWRPSARVRRIQPKKVSYPMYLRGLTREAWKKEKKKRKNRTKEKRKGEARKKIQHSQQPHNMPCQTRAL